MDYLETYPGEKMKQLFRLKVLMALLLSGGILIPSSFATDSITSRITSPPSAVDPLKSLTSEVLEFFKPRSFKIVNVENERIFIKAGTKDGIKRLMRFEITTPQPLRHPVTREEIGTVDVKTGLAEVEEVYEDYSILRLLKGSAGSGASAFLPERPLKVFLKEEAGLGGEVTVSRRLSGLDYFIAEDYLRALKSTGRFEPVNERKESDIIITLWIDDQAQALRHELAWSDTGMVFLSGEVRLSKEYLEKISKEKGLYEKEFRESDLLLSFRLPGSVRFINLSDVDGDRVDELVIAKDDSVEVYRMGVTLKGLYEIRLKGEIITLNSWDLNRNGRYDILVSYLYNDRVYSEILELRDGSFKSLYKREGFLRIVDGKILWQGYSSDEGPTGRIKELKININDGEVTAIIEKDVAIPVTSILSFNILKIGEENLLLSYDKVGYLNLFDKEGRLLWRSKEDTGGAFYTFKRPSLSLILREEEWSLWDRIIIEGERAYVIKRRPISGVARGIGWSSSMIVSLQWRDGNMTEEGIKEVGGAIMDFWITADRLYILQQPFMGISLGSLLKGENPKQTRLYIFKR